MLDTDKLLLLSKSEGWGVPLTDQRGQLYFEWKSEILFTQADLVIIHRHFYHPKSERLYSLIKRGVLGRTSAEVLRDLEKIESTCALCQRLIHAPHRFRVSLPERDIVLNRTVCMDIIFLEESMFFMWWIRTQSFPQLRFSKVRPQTRHGKHLCVYGFLCILASLT